MKVFGPLNCLWVSLCDFFGYGDIFFWRFKAIQMWFWSQFSILERFGNLLSTSFSGLGYPRFPRVSILLIVKQVTQKCVPYLNIPSIQPNLLTKHFKEDGERTRKSRLVTVTVRRNVVQMFIYILNSIWNETAQKAARRNKITNETHNKKGSDDIINLNNISFFMPDTQTRRTYMYEIIQQNSLSLNLSWH